MSYLTSRCRIMLYLKFSPVCSFVWKNIPISQRFCIFIIFRAPDISSVLYKLSCLYSVDQLSRRNVSWTTTKSLIHLSTSRFIDFQSARCGRAAEDRNPTLAVSWFISRGLSQSSASGTHEHIRRESTRRDSRRELKDEGLQIKAHAARFKTSLD